MLVLHTLLAGFYLRIAQVLQNSFRQPALAICFLIVALLFIVPLFVNLLDLWARTVASVREEKIAIRILELSLTIHRKLFGTNNAYYSEKQAMLASLYFGENRIPEAENLFADALKNYRKCFIKIPPLHSCFDDYRKILELKSNEASISADAGDSSSQSGDPSSQSVQPNSQARDPSLQAADTSSQSADPSSQSADTSSQSADPISHAENTALILELKKELRKTSYIALAQRCGIALLTVPILSFLITVQSMENNIARTNAKGKIVEALNEVSSLAAIESMVLGAYARCKVYKDYAQAFEDNAQVQEMLWCVSKAQSAMKGSNVQDDYVEVVLLNLQAKGRLAQANEDDAFFALERSAKICIDWDITKRSRNNFDASVEREKTLDALAELKRKRGDYAGAEMLFKKVLMMPDGPIDPAKMEVRTFEPIEAIDRLHKLQFIEEKLGKKEDAIALQKKVCEVLDAGLKKIGEKHKNTVLYDFGVRETARELESAAIMLADAGRNSEAAEYKIRAESMRKSRSNALKLDASQQDSIVDASTQITTDLLSIKYKAGDCEQSYKTLLAQDLQSDKAKHSFEELPWYDANLLKDGSKLKGAGANRRLEVDISPLSIRNSRESVGNIAVDVQGVVKIYKGKSTIADERKFGFAYIMKPSKTGGKAVLEELSDNGSDIQIDVN